MSAAVPRRGEGAEAAENFVAQRLTLRQLRVLLSLHETGSLVKTAERLHVSQPAISKTLSELEAGLGETLFVRRGRNARFTPLGLRLVELAQLLDAALRRSAGDVAALVKGASGVLRLGATNVALTELLPRAAARLKQEFPSVTISVVTHGVSVMFDELVRGQLDLVLARDHPGGERAALQRAELLDEREVLVISTLNPLSRVRRVGWETLNEQPWIWSLPGTRSRVQHERLWQRIGLPPPSNLIETGDVAFTLALMRRLPLLALMPRSVAAELARSGVLVMRPISDGLNLGSLSVWHAAQPLPPLAARMVALLREEASGETAE